MFSATSHLSWFLIQPFYDGSSLPKYFIGFAVFLYFLGAGLGNLFAERISLKFNEHKLLILILLFASLSFISMYFVIPLIGLFFILFGSFNSGIRDVVVNDGINKHTESHHRATVVSVQSMSKSIMYAVVAPLIGYFTDIYSASAAFLMMGVGLFAFLIFYIILIKIGKEK